MAKSKNKHSKESPKKTFTIGKPKVKIGKITFKKTDLKGILSNKIFKIFLMILSALLVFILVDLFFQYLNNDYSIAVVEGERIPKSKLHKTLETQYGQATTEQLVNEVLIKMEAEREDISASDEDIQKRIDEIIESIGGEEAYDSALLANNITEQELKEQIELDILATKILEPTLEYTEDDIIQFFDQYSSVIFPTETEQLEEGEKLDFDLYKDKVEEIYIQQEVENSKSSWLQDLKSKYRIQDNSVSSPKYGILSASINIFKNMFEDINSNEVEE
jgi:hypothetical protein